jgi:chaperonin cofactor prefoldin
MTVTIKEAIAEKLTASNEIVKNRLIDHLVEETLAKRVKQIESAYSEWEKLSKDLPRKQKPDTATYDQEGNILTETFSKSAFEALKQHKDRMARIEKAISEALDGKFDLLNKLGDKKSTSDVAE